MNRDNNKKKTTKNFILFENVTSHSFELKIVNLLFLLSFDQDDEEGDA